MPLVYVHGIGNRPGPDHSRRTALRDALFRRFLYPVIGADPDEPVHSPLWGDRGGALRWRGASRPGRLDETLGPADVSGAGGLAGDVPGAGDPADAVVTEAVAAERPDIPERLLCTVAGRDLADAVDLLFAATPSERIRDLHEAVAFAAHLVAYCRLGERLYPDADQAARYPWLATAADDQHLVQLLWDEARRWHLDAVGVPVEAQLGQAAEVLGPDRPVPGWVWGSLRLLRRAALGAPATAVARASRTVLADRVALLAGDILGYLSHRGDRDRPGPIVDVVGAALADACATRAAGTPLVVVAHSLGGVITYDVLSHFRPDITVDVLVTVGSQVALFEELTLLRSSDPALPTPDRPRAAVPSTIRSWINVVDPADVLGYQAEPVFDRVHDYRYPSAAFWAHGAYLRQPHFHARLADRVRQAQS